MAQSKGPIAQGCAGCLVAGLVVIVLIAVLSGGNGEDSENGDGGGLSPAECRQDFQCWGDEHSMAAAFKCDDQVERLARYSHKWTDGALEPKFSHFRWADKAKGTVTYIGDKIQFQNGFGAWQNHVYECDFDPASEQVLDVRAEPGRL